MASLGKLLKWMAPKVEEAGVDVFYEFPAVEALVEDGRVVGVRTGDKGISHEGHRKANYEPGVDIRAQVVVSARVRAARWSSSSTPSSTSPQGKNPQIYALGIKEVWDLPPGRVEAGRGHPHPRLAARASTPSAAASSTACRTTR